MCVVSNIYDYGRKVWPTYPTVSPPAPTPEQWEAFRELVEKARKFDELAGQPDCEDPTKAEWMAEIEARIAALEAERDK